MSKKHGCGGGYNMHHRTPKAQGGRDNWPQNNLVRVLVCRHALWNRIANGRDRASITVIYINEYLARFGIQVKLERTH